MTCEHKNFGVNVGVNRLARSGGRPMQFIAEFKVTCLDCGEPFRFLGLQPGMDLHGARCSVNGLEARLAIAPEGDMPSPLDRMAYTVGGKH